MTFTSRENPILAALRDYAAEQSVTHEIVGNVAGSVVGTAPDYQGHGAVFEAALASSQAQWMHALHVLRRLHYLTLDTGRECSRCGDEVQYLDSRDECDGCAMADRCLVCDGDVDEVDGRERFENMCTGCVHDAERCGA